MDHLQGGAEDHLMSDMGKELVEKAMASLRDLEAATERAISQLERQSADDFEDTELETTRALSTASRLPDYQKVVQSFKARVLANITNERHKEAVVRSRVSSRVLAVVAAVHQGMKQEMQAQLDAKKQATKRQQNAHEDMLRMTRSAKQLEIDNAVRKALAEGSHLNSQSFESSAMVWKMQLQQLQQLAELDRERYPRKVVEGWVREELRENPEDTYDQLAQRGEQITAMISWLGGQSDQLDRLPGMIADNEKLKAQNELMSNQCATLQEELAALRAQMEQMAADHAAELSALNERWSSEMQGMTPVNHSGDIEKTQERLASIESAVEGFDQLLMRVEGVIMEQPLTASEAKAARQTLLSRRGTKTESGGGGEPDATVQQLQQLTSVLDGLFEDMLAVKGDTADKVVALTALQQQRGDDASARLAELQAAAGNHAGSADASSQFVWGDIGELDRPQSKGVQVERRRKTLEVGSQTRGAWKPTPTPSAAVGPGGVHREAQTEGYFTLDALTVRSARREQGTSIDGLGTAAVETATTTEGQLELPLVDPEALRRMEELIEQLHARDAQIAKQQVAIETLTKMIELGESKVTAPDPVPIQVEEIPLAPDIQGMVQKLRAELQRAYSLIQALEEAAPGSTPAVFKNLLHSHTFCLFCGAPSGGERSAAHGREALPNSQQWRTDNEANIVLKGGAGFVKFWYGRGTEGAGGRAGTHVFGGETARPSSRSGPPGAGPAGWGGAGAGPGVETGALGTEAMRPPRGRSAGQRQSSAEWGWGSNNTGGEEEDHGRGGGPRPSLNDAVGRVHSSAELANHGSSSQAVPGRRRPHTSHGHRQGSNSHTGSVSGLSRRPKSAVPAVSMGLSTVSVEEAAMLQRSQLPSAQAMSRRLKASSWSRPGSAVPSFRAGSGLALPNERAVGASRVASRAASLGGVPREGASRQSVRRGRSADDGGRRSAGLEGQAEHMQRFLEAL